MRTLLETATMAVVMALLLKGFLVDAYRIPSGSMQPTLIGDDASGIHDRILVDKVSWAFGDPQRFQVAVFRFQPDRSKAYVKRIVGIGPEEIRIRHGDLWRRDGPDEPWAILRRPPAVAEAAWRAMDRRRPEGPSWGVVTAGTRWRVAGRSISARGAGRARFRHEHGSLRDWYLDGYQEPLRSLIDPRPQRSGRNPVGDLRLDLQASALPGATRVTLELFEGSRRYAFRVPGPAADDDARPRIEADDPAGPWHAEAAAEPWRLPAGRPVRLRAQNMDDRLELRVEGRTVATLEVPPAEDQTSDVFVAVEGEGADLDELMVYRDVYYTDDEAKRSEYAVPEGHYFVLGDNSQDSSDSRDWMLARLRVREDDAAGPVLRGEAQRGKNPRLVNWGDPEGPRSLFRDEFGEEHWIDPDAIELLTPEHVPFVPRSALIGRAVAVFWPLEPRRGLWRLGFVR